jgi:large subunit ribosomal protein L3
MINTLLGIKKNMTSTYDARRRRVGATVIEIAPNLVTQIKKADGKDGYSAVQLGIGTKKSVKKPQIGQAKKAGIDKKIRWLKEVKMEDGSLKVENLGKEIKVGDVFRIGDAVKVSGISKGRGFQGGVRRHGFHGGPKTHGQSDRHRDPGSIGAGTTPGRVYKGKRMAGHMGVEKSSIRGLEVVEIDKENNLLWVKGGVPGYNGALLEITKLGKIKGYTPPPEEKEEELEEPEIKKPNESEIKGEENAKKD